MIVIGGNIINADVEDSVVITKEIAPLEDVSSRSGFYSKTFTIVGDAEAHKTFNHLFETNITIQNTSSENFNPDFNPNLKASFQYWVDDLVAFEGFCKLDDITIEDEMVKYHLTAFGGAGQFFEKMGESRLEDLDMSAYDHDFTRANVVASWSNDYTDGYVYPMIDYGHKEDRSWWSWFEFRPAVFVKAIWDQIFEEAGWSYESTFLSTNHFEKLVIPSPSSSTQLTSSEVNDLTFTVANDTAFSVPNSKDLSAATPFEFPFDTGSLLANSLQNTSATEWDTTNHLYEPTRTLAAEFRLKFVAKVEYIGASAVSPVGAVRARFSLIRNRGGVYSRLETFEIGNFFTFTFTSSTLVSGMKSTNFEDVNIETAEHDIEPGDVLFLALTDIDIQTVGGAGRVMSGVDGDWQINIQAGTIFGNIVNPTMKDGQTVSLARATPDWTQRQFMQNISKMFNLYIEQIGDKTLLIEPRDEGYLQPNRKDWTDKISYDKERKITPMGELNKKQYYFTYEQDYDIWNSQYSNSFDGRLYGDKEVYVNNDFQTEEEEIKLDFAPTVLSNSRTAKINNNRVISDISFYNDDGLPEVRDGKPRILYYGGLIDGDTWTLVDGKQVGAATDVDHDTYPYAGHLDDPITPTFDYLWFFPKNTFYNRAYGGTDYPQYPNRNLYNLYWYRFINEITDKDSKIFEGWFDISYSDWVNISFRDLYHFLDSDWRLIKVSDYDLENGGLTYCKFLKSGAWVNPTYDRYKLNTGYGETDDNGDTLPFIYKGEGTGSNKFPDQNDWGSGNIVNGSTGFVYGDANLVGTGVVGFGLINASGNNVQAPGAVLINTDGREVNIDDEIWINNINYERYQEITLNYTAVQDLHNGYPVLPDPESNQYYEVTRVSLKYEHNGTNYVTSGADIDLDCGDSGLLLATQQDDPLSGSSDTNYLFAIAATTVTPTRDLDDRLGQPLELSSSSAITGNGGDVTFRIYYKIVEI